MITLNKTNLKKDELRKIFLKKRHEMYKLGIMQVQSSFIINKIKKTKIFQEAKHIALYYPFGSEINLSDFLNIKNKNFYLPRTKGYLKGAKMEFVQYTGKLINGEFNIKTPIGPSINPTILDVIYIPALAANSKGYRLGYGRGFYDNFFRENKNMKAKKVIVTLSDFITDDFIEDDFDEKCDMIQSEAFCKIC